MLKFFICPDGQEVNKDQCVNGKCRMGKRCLTLPTLQFLAECREWKGIPSVTQLQKGTYEAFLTITQDYAEDPQEMMFRLLGTNVHASLETDLDSVVSEGRTEMDGISGTFDLLESEDNWNILTDYKVAGSYKVAKALGVYYTMENSATEVYQMKTTVTVNGIKEIRMKGDPKVIKTWKMDYKKQDCEDWIFQLNRYRMHCENTGRRVDEMRIQAIVRDGGTINAANNGLDKRVYLIPIPRIDDQIIITYFNKKRDDLLSAVKRGDWDEKCTEDETWQGRKCEKYCSVSKFCKFMKKEEVKNEEDDGTNFVDNGVVV